MLSKLLLLLLSSSIVLAEIRHFNSTLQCRFTDHCLFHDSRIWEGGGAPEDGDTVYLIGKSISGYTLFVSNTSVMLELLYISGSFVLQSNVSKPRLEVVAMILDTGASLVLQNTGLLNTGATQLNDKSMLAVESADSVSIVLAGHAGSGSIKISNSTVRLTNPYLTPTNETIYIQGSSVVTIDGLKLIPKNLVFDATTNITLQVIWMELEGDISIPGDIVVQDGHLGSNGILIARSLSIAGGEALVTGSLVTEQPIRLTNSLGTLSTALTLCSAVLTAPAVIIHNSCELSTRGSSTIVGDVENGGVLLLNEEGDIGNQNLTIKGNFTQVNEGIFVAYMSTKATATVIVSGSADIQGGVMNYVADDENVPYDQDFVALVALTNLTGTFNGNLHSYLKSSADLFGMHIKYDNSSVILYHSHGSKRLFGIGVSVVVGIVFISFLVVLVTVIIARNWLQARKKQRGYTLLPIKPINE